MILITGATGTTGRDVVGELARLGAERVRVLARDPRRAGFARDAGFEAVEGDFERPDRAPHLRTVRPRPRGKVSEP